MAKNPATGTYDKYWDVWGITPEAFVEMAEQIRQVCWAPIRFAS